MLIGLKMLVRARQPLSYFPIASGDRAASTKWCMPIHA